MGELVTKEQYYRRVLELIYRESIRSSLYPVPAHFDPDAEAYERNSVEMRMRYKSWLGGEIAWKAEKALAYVNASAGQMIEDDFAKTVELESAKLYVVTNAYTFSGLFRNYEYRSVYCCGDVKLDIHGYRPINVRMFDSFGEYWNNTRGTVFYDFEVEFQRLLNAPGVLNG